MIISQLLVISRVSTVQIGHIDGEMIISQLLVISRVSTVQIGVTVISLVSFMSKQMVVDFRATCQNVVSALLVSDSIATLRIKTGSRSYLPSYDLSYNHILLQHD